MPPNWGALPGSPTVKMDPSLLFPNARAQFKVQTPRDWDDDDDADGNYDVDEVVFRKGCAIPQPVRYTTRDWWHVLLRWPRSKLWRRISPVVNAFTGWALFVTVVSKVTGAVAQLPLATHGLLGSALGLLLVYRTNSANNRFWEGRKMWERVVSSSRDIATMINVHDRHIGAKKVRRVSALLSAFAVTLTEYVVGPRKTKHILPLWRLVPEDEAFIQASSSPPVRVAQLLLQEITQIPNSKDMLFTNRERSDMGHKARDLIHSVAQGEKLVQTPIPQSYVRHTSRFLTLWLVTLPFGLCHVVGWYTPLVVMAVSWALVGINDLGLGIEHPFTGPQSLRMAVMCNTVHAAVTDAMHGTAMERFRGIAAMFLGRDLEGARFKAPESQSHEDDLLAAEVRATDKLLGRTPLHHAVYNGDVKLVHRLMDAGANINAQDTWDGSTPLDVALARNHHVLVQKLQAAGARSRIFNRCLFSLPKDDSSYEQSVTSGAVLA
jgi:predicted membrane chloride channel (bestrophin family)